MLRKAGGLTPATAEKWSLLRERLADIARRHPDAALASSLAAEDMLLTHAIFSDGIALEVFSLDTGRLHAETYRFMERVRKHYRLDLDVVNTQVEQWIQAALDLILHKRKALPYHPNGMQFRALGTDGAPEAVRVCAGFTSTTRRRARRPEAMGRGTARAPGLSARRDSARARRSSGRLLVNPDAGHDERQEAEEPRADRALREAQHDGRAARGDLHRRTGHALGQVGQRGLRSLRRVAGPVVTGPRVTGPLVTGPPRTGFVGPTGSSRNAFAARQARSGA